MAVPARLLERAEDLEALATVLVAALRGTGGLALVEGAAGLGKTSLLDAVTARGRSHFHVLRAVGRPLDQDAPFALVRTLLTPLAAGRSLHGAEELAGPVVAPSIAPAAVEPTPDRLAATLHGLHWLVASSSAQAPLLLVVDDAQVADVASLRFLAHLATRLGDLRCALLVAARPPGETLPAQALDAYAALRAAASTVRSPAPLSGAAVAELVAELPQVTAVAEVARACHSRTRGNPFLVRELLRDLARHDTVDTETVEATLPASITDDVAARMRTVTAPARALMLAIAVLDGDVLAGVAAQLAGVSPAELAPLVDELVQAGLTPLDGRLAAAHPLVAEAVLDQPTAAQGAELHARAATALAAAGADRGRIVSHIVHATPGLVDGAAATLLMAARDAAASGAHVDGARLLRRALEESPETGMRLDILMELGRAESATGAPTAAERFADVRAATDDPGLRDAATEALAITLFHQQRRVELRALARDAVTTASPSTQMIVRSVLMSDYMVGSEQGSASEPPDIRLTPSTRGERALLAQGAFVALVVQSAPVPELVAAAERALGGGELLDEAGPAGPPFLSAVCVLLLGGAFDQAGGHLDRALARVRRAPSPLALGALLTFTAYRSLQLGLVDDAVAEAEEALAHVERVAPATVATFTCAFLVNAYVEADRAADAIALLDRVGLRGPLPDGLAHDVLLVGRGRVHAAVGDLDAARADLEACGARQRVEREASPAPLPWRSALANVMAQLGERSAAVVLAEEELRRARAFEHPGAIAAAARAAAEAEPDSAAAPSFLEEADAAASSSPHRLERMRCQVALGATLRAGENRDDATARLHAALQTAEQGGAAVLAARARIALGLPPAEGLGPRLHAAELRAARMAAQGLTNREIAEATFSSSAEVTALVGSAQRKLGAPTRAKLADQLPGDTSW